MANQNGFTPQPDVSAGQLLDDSDMILYGVDDCAAKFRVIHRLLAYLIKRQKRVPFQWEVMGDAVFFRVKFSHAVTPESIAPFVGLFDFYLEDLVSFDLGSICAVTIKDDIVQFRIDITSHRDPARAHPLISFLVDQTVRMLWRLPKRSQAATTVMPVMYAPAAAERVTRVQLDGAPRQAGLH